MASDVTKPQPERDRTDASLRTEREKSDRSMLDRQAADDASEDATVARAREKADAVLEVAREKADDQLASDEPRAAVSEERSVADELVRDERAAADAQVKREREERARALWRLLPLEREATDQHLLTERSRSDHEIASRDDFLGIVTHDLRNLLGGIVLSASLLAENAPAGGAGETARSSSARIHRYAARMNRLIGDLVDVVSIDAGRLAMTPSMSDAGELVVEAVDTFQASAVAKGLVLRAEVAGVLAAEFDRDRLLQLLANLISNAIKFTASGGTIVVRGERVGEAIRLSVRDDGVGIAREVIETIFGRFWQVGKNDRRGLGLGLYISRCIAEAHHGTIVADSRPGAGSCFTCTIPRAQPHLDSAAAPPATA
jgi:signal transduction histidine kinase